MKVGKRGRRAGREREIWIERWREKEEMRKVKDNEGIK